MVFYAWTRVGVEQLIYGAQQMIRILSAAVAAAFFVVPAFAQTKKSPPPAPGQSEYAPGHQPGDAKKSAPGQRMQKKDDPKSPGASEYAPGQQGKTSPTKK
jgi:hypothetical protein